MRTMTASSNLAAHATTTTDNGFHPSPAWEEKMALLEQIHGEIAPHDCAVDDEPSSGIEINYLFD